MIMTNYNILLQSGTKFKKEMNSITQANVSISMNNKFRVSLHRSKRLPHKTHMISTIQKAQKEAATGK